MGQDSKIEWTHHTFNPWRGCTKVSAGCTNCYAETLSHRNPLTLGVWGPKGTRVVAAESMWRQPVKWDREAKAAGERRRVFCASLADVFEDRPDLIAPRVRLWQVIESTLNLDWLLLTKRPENIERMMPAMWLMKRGTPIAGCTWKTEWVNDWKMPRNVWLGVSVEDQKAANERIPILKKTPARIRFLSVEPLLSNVDFFHGPGDWGLLTGINWVIVGGESGPGARPCDLRWVRSIVEQCKVANISCFVKQLGAAPLWQERDSNGQCWEDFPRNLWREPLMDRKGGDITEFPADLRVRQFPEPAPCPRV